MGWFEDVDYKRALLVYDRIHYLFPEQTVPFVDVSGKTQHVHFPEWLTERSDFVIHHHPLTERDFKLLQLSAAADVADPAFAEAVSVIPASERLYTWRVANADPAFGRGQSLALDPSEQPRAHALVLNRFMLAAHSSHTIPITGKNYIQRLLSAKYQLAMRRSEAHSQELIPRSLRRPELQHAAVVDALVSEFISNDELERVSYDDIIEFRRTHRLLFERFSALVRDLLRRIDTLPSDATFDGELRELLNTEVWRRKIELEAEMRETWMASFRSAAKELAGSGVAKSLFKTGFGVIALGIIPALSLGSLVAATAIAAAGASSWALSELVDLIQQRGDLEQHGLYYLMRFASSAT